MLLFLDTAANKILSVEVALISKVKNKVSLSPISKINH